ncbi:archaemetzincin [Acrasis kona]|uniref:Archaemetzincin n=1 Tax=Acrasis kona TaxID=1008807 RepID=A0AAW2YQ95_9EUKA
MKEAITEVSGNNLFSGKVFVISNSYNKYTNPTYTKVEILIKSNGGIVSKKISAKADYYVQSYEMDDDSKLELVKSLKISVIGHDYVEHCVQSGSKVNFKHYALSGKNKDNLDLVPLIQKEDLFPKILDYSREEEEQPQTFYDFIEMERYSPDEQKKYIYVAKLDVNGDVNVNILMKFISAYFSLPTKQYNNQVKVTPNKRRNKMCKIQIGDFVYDINTRKPVCKNTVTRINAMDVLDMLVEVIPKDAFCIVAITDQDIYEFDDDSSILMGRATGDRVCVVSTCRFDLVNSKVEFNNFLKTLAHEICHVFGIDHCIFFSCVMNAIVGDENVEPMWLCPVDLSKLRKSVGFEIQHRYRNLITLFKEFSMTDEVSWIEKILNELDVNKTS